MSVGSGKAHSATNVMVIDDLRSASDAESSTLRELCVNWYTVLLPRLGCTPVTRVHVEKNLYASILGTSNG